MRITAAITIVCRRLPGRGHDARLTLHGQREITALIRDISMGGVALNCDARATAGMEASVTLPGVAGVIAARVARCDGTFIGLAFKQDAATLARIDTALRHIEKEPSARAA